MNNKNTGGPAVPCPPKDPLARPNILGIGQPPQFSATAPQQVQRRDYLDQISRRLKRLFSRSQSTSSNH